MLFKTARNLGCALVISTGLMLSSIAVAGTAGNPLCPGEEVSFDPGNGEDIIVPTGFMVSVFAKGLNFPTGKALRRHQDPHWSADLATLARASPLSADRRAS
jgi:hypothetical protein